MCLEFGAGSHTFNPVFGATRNPYDTIRTCGGSSGGAAVALAAGMLPIADGSDMGGSLRNPASFCNVVGFRPSPGRVPRYPKSNAWSTLAVDGPMGRTVQDVALMLSAIAGYDPRSPIAIQQPGSMFLQSLDRDFKEVRIAWSPDLGEFPVDQAVVSTIQRQLQVFGDLGCQVEGAAPDFRDAYDIFQTLRAWNFELSFAEPFAELAKNASKIRSAGMWRRASVFRPPTSAERKSSAAIFTIGCASLWTHMSSWYCQRCKFRLS